MRILVKSGLLVLLALYLTGCYLPIRFDAEIEIDRAGFYSMIFDGYVAHLPLYADIAAKKVDSLEERERAARLETDLTRDSAVKEFKYLKQGIFKVHWDKKGDLMRHRMVTFFRRNAAMLTLKYDKNKRLITLTAGGVMSPEVRQRILDSGLNMNGEVRVITDARVERHNATSTRKMTDRPGKTMYIWRIESIVAKMPIMVIVPG
jgi:hypothetical protein